MKFFASAQVYKSDKVCSGRPQKGCAYVALFPEGFEAGDKKEALNRAQNLLKEGSVRAVNGTNCYNVIMEDGVTVYANLRAVPYKYINERLPISSRRYLELAEAEFVEILESHGYDTDFCANGIKVNTGVDTWIVDLKESSGVDVEYLLLHKNNVNSQKIGKGSPLQGYHRQDSGRATVEEIAKKMISHQNKWKGKNVRN